MSLHRSPAPSNPRPRSNRPSPGSLRSNLAAWFVTESPPRAELEILAFTAGDVDRGEGTVLTTAKDRATALEALKAGKLSKIRVSATTFIQRDTPNRNFVRFKPGIMPTLGKSFTGQPFLRDHNKWELESRGGTIVDSKTTHNEDGSKSIVMVLELVKPWAMEGVLDGTIDRFSIGWSRTGPVECSYHGASISKCDCWPGDKMGDGKIVEFVFTGAEGTEVSAVNVPAVVGTGIEAISQLGSVDRGDLLCMLVDNPPTDNPEPAQMKLILTALALAATATEEDAVAAIEQRDDELRIAKEQAIAAKAELVTVQLAQKTAADATQKTATEAAIGKLIAGGKLKPKSKSEDALRRMAGRDFGAFEAQLADILENGPTVTPVGARLHVTTEKEPASLEEKDGDRELAENPHLPDMLRKAGITREQFQKHGASARTTLAAKTAAGY